MSDSVWIPLWLSLKIALWATGLNLVLGIAVGFLLARRHFPGRTLLDTVLTLPMVMPPTVMGYYLLVLLGSQGWLGQWLMNTFGIRLIFTWQGAVIAAMVVSFPLIFKPARAAFEAVNRRYEHAAMGMGLGRLAVFMRITLPLAWRAILVGVLLGFARCLGEFGATLIVAGAIPGRTETMSITIYEAIQNGQDDVAQQLVLIMLLVAVLVLALVTYLSRKKKGVV